MSSGRTTAAESRPDESIVVHESTNSKLTHGGAGPRKQERPGAVYARRGAMQDLVEVRTHKKVFSDVRSLFGFVITQQNNYRTAAHTRSIESYRTSAVTKQSHDYALAHKAHMPCMARPAQRSFLVLYTSTPNVVHYATRHITTRTLHVPICPIYPDVRPDARAVPYRSSTPKMQNQPRDPTL